MARDPGLERAPLHAGCAGSFCGYHVRMNKTRVALIGAGGLAGIMHHPSLATFDDVTLVAVCDLDAARAEATAERYGIAETFMSYRKMLDTVEVDAVYAIMPPMHVFPVAMDVLEAGYALFIEKPPGMTTHQTRAMARRAEQKKLVTGVGFQRRYHPLLHHCYEKVCEKGAPHQVTAAFLKQMPVSETHPYYDGAIDILTCDVVHAVDAVRYYAGLSPVRTVSAVVRQLDCWFDVSFNALVHFENDAVGIMESNFRTGRRHFTFSCHATGASALARIDGLGEVWWDGGDDPVVSTDYQAAAGSGEERVHQGFTAQARAFIDAVQAGVPPHNNLSDAVATMDLVDRIYAAAGGRLERVSGVSTTG